jgi:hypothetical protein
MLGVEPSLYIEKPLPVDNGNDEYGICFDTVDEAIAVYEQLAY